MTKNELREELDSIERIFSSTKYLSTDFTYFSEQEIMQKYPNIYAQYYFLLNRIWFSITVNLILNLSKLYDDSEKYSIKRLLNKIKSGFKNSELSLYITESELLSMFKLIDNERINQLKSKLKILRDKFYAHLDRTHSSFMSVYLTDTEIVELVENIENILIKFKSGFFNISVDFDLTIPELGHNILERLNERELYWEKYGIIKKDNQAS